MSDFHVEFTVNKDKYVILYDNLEIDNYSIDADIYRITKNGKPEEYFGENFAGHKYNGVDVLTFAILGYINNDQAYSFNLVPKQIQELKAKYFKPFMTVEGREVPEIFVDTLMQKLELVMVTDTCAAYAGPDEEAVLVDVRTGTVITDIFAFFISGACQVYKEDEILYIRDDFKEFLDEYTD